MDKVFEYEVVFVGDDTSVRITITEDTDDIPHEAIAVRAEEMLKELWGVRSIPSAYVIIDVSVYEIAL